MIVVDDSDDDNVTLLLIMFVVIKILMIWHAIKSGMRVNTVCTIPPKVQLQKSIIVGICNIQLAIFKKFDLC